MKHLPFVYGIYGTIGSGKTTVAKMIEQDFGYYSIDCDALGHRLLEDHAIKNDIIHLFGLSILNKDNKIDRKKLSKVVFVNPVLKNQLEQLIWPKMTYHLKEIIAEEKEVIIDAAVLFSAGWNSLCQVTVYVEASREKVESFLKDRKMMKTYLKNILSTQQVIRNQKKLATYILYNDGTIQDLRQKVSDMIKLIKNSWAKNKEPK